jgi:hypothetical protein
MQIFSQMRALAEFSRRHLPFLKTVEDQDLVREIGHHQAAGAPLTLTQLLVIGAGSRATVQRRLQRLKRLGVVLQSRSKIDRRVFQLALSPDCMKVFVKYGTFLSGAREYSAAGSRAQGGPAQHVCALCDGDASSRDMAVRFLRHGAPQRQKCVLMGPRRFLDATLAELERGAGKRAFAGQVTAHRGETSAESMLAFFRPIFEEARADGKAIYLVGDMSWSQRKMDFDTLMDFEARVDRLLRQFEVKALCQYDVRRFSGPRLLRALKVHRDTERYPLTLG